MPRVDQTPGARPANHACHQGEAGGSCVEPGNLVGATFACGTSSRGRRPSGAPVAGVISFTDRGDAVADQVSAALMRDGWDCQVTRGHGKGGLRAGEWVASCFKKVNALVFVGALGIAVRLIAPYVTSKAEDPAVIVVDEAGRWSIPVLSGHLGGANELARAISGEIGASLVLTCASDIRGVWAPDTWARSCGLIVANPERIVTVTSKILAGDSASIGCDDWVELEGELPRGVVLAGEGEAPDVYVGVKVPCADHAGDLPLWLVPPVATLGLGCRKGVQRDDVEGLVDDVLEAAHITELAVDGVVSIDLKADEPALVELCERRGWPFETRSAAELTQVGGSTASSDFVLRVTGVDNVCERAALSHRGRLVIPRQVGQGHGVTAALAIRKVSLSLSDCESAEPGEDGSASVSPRAAGDGRGDATGESGSGRQAWEC